MDELLTIFSVGMVALGSDPGPNVFIIAPFESTMNLNCNKQKIFTTIHVRRMYTINTVQTTTNIVRYLDAASILYKLTYKQKYQDHHHY